MTVTRAILWLLRLPCAAVLVLAYGVACVCFVALQALDGPTLPAEDWWQR